MVSKEEVEGLSTRITLKWLIID